MFTGIVEATGEVTRSDRSASNLELEVRSPISHELHVNQSVSHNGACFTVTRTGDGTHIVTVIAESLGKTTAGDWRPGDRINLERAMLMNGRLDGHLVQGHVDTVALCEKIEDHDGSAVYQFTHPQQDDFITIKKGSVCVNGVSLTAVESGPGFFTVAVIPFTLQHTNLGTLKTGDKVNVEFDLVGKYLRKIVLM